MGRKSALTPEQWAQIERRHLVGGESVNSLAKEFGINESAIRRKINPNKSEQAKSAKPLRELAREKADADTASRRIAEQIAELPMSRQTIVNDLAQKLVNISGHLASAAEYGAATAHRLIGIAHGEVAKIDDTDPLSKQSLTTLAGISALTKMANESSEIARDLLRANKEQIERLNNPEKGKIGTITRRIIDSKPVEAK
jgi:transposase-like protein